MTAPHDNAAKYENSCASGGIGRTLPDVDGAPDDVPALGMNDATTREHTYRTICSLIAVLSPKMIYPPINPAINVSDLRSFPPFSLRCSNRRALYNDTKPAKLSACSFVAVKMCRARAFQSPRPKRMDMSNA